MNDPRLPGLATALDVDRFLERLRRGLPECPEEMELLGGRIFDVQYAPGERGVVLYQLKLRERGGSRSQRQLLSVRALQPGDAPTPPRNRTLARYRALEDQGLHTPYVPLPEEGLVAHAFPIDPGLAGLLDANDGVAVRAALQDLWRERGVRVHQVKPRCLGYTPGARAALRYEVSSEDRATGAPELRHLVGKLHAHKRASATFAKSWAAWMASGRRVPLAPPVGFLPHLDLSLQEYVEGERLGDLAGTATFGARLREVARALCTFHGLPIPVASRRSADKEIAVVDRWCAAIASLRPDLSGRVTGLRGRIASRLEDAVQVSAVVHGDFHPANVLAGRDGVRLIDLDQMARGDPLLDVGRFLASLRVSALRVSGDLSALDEAAAGFLDHYIGRSGESESRARLFEAACLLTAAGTGFRLQREGWQQNAERLFDEAERVLSCSDAVAARESAPRPPSSRVNAARWHDDALLLLALLDEPIREASGAVATRCRVRRDRQGRHLRLQLGGLRDGARWKATFDAVAGVRRQHAGLETWARLRETLASQPGAPRLPRLIAHLSPLELLVVERCAGRSLARLIDSPEAPQVAACAGAALAILHAAPITPDRRRTVAGEQGAARRRVSELGAARPHLAERGAALCELAVQRVAGSEQDCVPGIGRLGPEDILWDGRDVAFAHAGTLAATHPALDLAETLARIAACERGRDAGGAVECVVSRLRSAYLERSPLDPAALQGFEALALLRMACRAVRRGDGASADALVACAARRLGEAACDPATPVGSARHDGCGVPLLSEGPSMARLRATLARECRGRTAVLGPQEPALLDALSRRGLDVLEVDPVAVRDPGRCEPDSAEAFDTLVVHGLLEHASKKGRQRWIEWARQRLGADGRLVVCVPNPDACPATSGTSPLDRRRLRRLLRSLGRARLVTGQPYRWLVMRVDASERPSPGVRERYRVIADLCRGRVLELGCGPGNLCAVIAERGLSVEGVDLNPEKIERARERLPGMRFTACDILELDAGGQRADTVVLSEVLEHVDETVGNAILERAWSFVAPGGRLIVSVPNEDCVPHPNHVREFDHTALSRLLERFAPPRISVEQPFRYLLMFLDRPEADPASV